LLFSNHVQQESAEAGAASGLRKSSSALDDPDSYCHQRQEQEDMDKPSKGVRSQKSETPKDKEDERNSPKHSSAFRLV